MLKLVTFLILFSAIFAKSAIGAEGDLRLVTIHSTVQGPVDRNLAG